MYHPTCVLPFYQHVSFAGIAKEVAFVDIAGDEYRRVVDYSRNNCASMPANWKSAQYSRGLSNNDSDPHQAERVGSLGELAFAKLFGLGTKFYYKRGGEDVDFNIAGVTFDIKMRLSKKYENVFITAINSTGQRQTLKSEMYVFGYLVSEACLQQAATVALVGYASRDEVKGWGLHDAFRGNHKNYQSTFTNLRSIRTLYETLIRVTPAGTNTYQSLLPQSYLHLKCVG